MTKRISVVVPTLYSGIQLLRCLESLMKQSLPPYEIIVVGVCSRSKEIETNLAIDSYPIRYCVQDRRGLVYAYNYGVKKSRGEVVAFIDDDALADPDWLKKIDETYAFSNNVGAVGGRTIEYGNSQTISIETLRKLTPKCILLKIAKSIFNQICLEDRMNDIGVITRSGAVLGNFSIETKGPKKVDHLKGVNMSFRKDILKEVGFFNVKFDIGHAPLFETDACYKVRNLGYDIWHNPQAVVYHFSSSSGSDISSFIHNDCLFYFLNVRKSREYNDLRFGFRLMSQVLFFLFANLGMRSLKIPQFPSSFEYLSKSFVSDDEKDLLRMKQ